MYPLQLLSETTKSKYMKLKHIVQTSHQSQENIKSLK